MHKHVFQLFHVCAFAKMISYKVTSRKVTISTSYAPNNFIQECCHKRAHMEKLDNFLWLSKSLFSMPEFFKLTYHTMI